MSDFEVVNCFSNAIVVSEGDSITQYSNTPRNRVRLVHKYSELFPPFNDCGCVVLSHNPEIKFERNGVDEIRVYYEEYDFPIRVKGSKMEHVFKAIDTYENGETEYALQYMEDVIDELAEDAKERLAESL